MTNSTDPSTSSGQALEYCVRQVFHDPDKSGRVVVPWRPVGEVIAASKAYGRHEHQRGYALGGNLLDDADRALRESIAARKRLDALLGLAITSDADR